MLRMMYRRACLNFVNRSVSKIYLFKKKKKKGAGPSRDKISMMKTVN